MRVPAMQGFPKWTFESIVILFNILQRPVNTKWPRPAILGVACIWGYLAWNSVFSQIRRSCH